MGWRSASWWCRQNIMNILEEMGIDLATKREIVRKAREEAELIQRDGLKRKIELERIHGVYYAHDMETSEFMGQHADREELFKMIAERYGKGRYEVVDNSAD